VRGGGPTEQARPLLTPILSPFSAETGRGRSAISPVSIATTRQRLDVALVAAGFAPTRARARDLILRGFVRVNGALCDKPAQAVAPGATIQLADESPAFVSRGAEKLAAALDQFGFDPKGGVGLDIGASTGGFTQVLLGRGARKVYAVDVGHGQLHASLQNDPRVVSLESCDARRLTRHEVPEPPDLIVADVSFISLVKVLPAVLALAAPRAGLVALVKPQFELSPAEIGKGGIVRDEAARTRAVENVRAFIAAQAGWSVRGVVQSPILGGSGNVEFLLGAAKHG